MSSNSKHHWEHIYTTKQSHELSWTQDVPKTSLDFVRGFGLSKSADIIDVGGGDSRFVDFLLQEGYENISVLDISDEALKRSRERLGVRAARVTWFVGEMTEFVPVRQFDLWHDRAAFHFLTTQKEIQKYVAVLRKAVKENGYVILSTFSDAGPKRCSGLDITQYSEATLAEALAIGFEKIACVTEDHLTPFGTKQNFLFCSFRRVTADIGNRG